MEIFTYGAYTDGIDLWLPSANMNALFHQNLINSERLEFLCSFENIEHSEAYKIGNVLCFENTLFFFSQYAYVVWILNLHTQEMKKIKYYERKKCFVPDIVQVANEAWVMPRDFDTPIIIFDMLSRDVKYLELERSKEVSDKYSFIYAWQEKGKIYFSTRTHNNIHVCQINCATQEMRYQSLNKIRFINCLTVRSDSLYVLALDDEYKAVLKKFSVRNMVEEDRIELKAIDPLWSDATMFYFKMISFNNYIIMLPSVAEKIVIYNIDTKQDWAVSLPDEFFEGCRKANKSYFCKMNMVGNKLYLFPHFGKYLVIFDLEDFSFELKKIVCDEEEVWKKYGEKETQRREVIEETVHVAINNYLNCILSMTDDVTGMECFECGKHIYDALCGIK